METNDPSDKENHRVFKRKKKSTDQSDIASEVVEGGPDDAAARSDDTEASNESFDENAFQQAVEGQPVGPYDASAVPPGSVKRVDLGAIQVAGFTDMQLHFDTDPSQRVVSVVASYRDAALRLQPLAAPRSGGLWEEMRPQIVSSITGIGGDVEEVDGIFGVELHGVVPAVTPDGQQVRQPVRLVGVEGPRWLLHGVFMGSAPMDDAMGELFEDVFQQVVVVRDAQPMAPGEVLPLVLPPEAQPAPQGQADGTPGAPGSPMGPGVPDGPGAPAGAVPPQEGAPPGAPDKKPSSGPGSGLFA